MSDKFFKGAFGASPPDAGTWQNLPSLTECGPVPGLSIRRDEEMVSLRERLSAATNELAALRERVAELERAARDAIRCNDKGCMYLHPNFCPAQCQADAALRAVLRAGPSGGTEHG
jgi:hypothetical protein